MTPKERVVEIERLKKLEQQLKGELAYTQRRRKLLQSIVFEELQQVIPGTGSG